MISSKQYIFTERIQIWFWTCARFECFHKVLKISELEAGYSLIRLDYGAWIIRGGD